MTRVLAVLGMLSILAACGTPEVSEQAQSGQADSAGGEPTSEAVAVTAAAEPPYVQLLAVGDIASCDSEGDEKVAAVAKANPGRIALLGDIVYPSSTTRAYRDCFNPAWGSMGPRFRPAVGNHEYYSDNAQSYWDYFGDFSGARDRGWYAYDGGPHWRVIVLNSNCSKVGGCGPTSRQGKWLAGALQRAGDRHVMAYFHAPRFSSGQHGSNPAMAPFWQALYRGGADVVLNGHDHMYERFVPQNPVGEFRRYGIQQFTVGTGGYKNYPFGGPPLPRTAVRQYTTFGLLAIQLRPGGYSWRFIPADGDFTDSGARTLR